MSTGSRLVRWIGLAIGLPALLAVVLLGADVARVIRDVNRNAFERERGNIEHGLKLLGELHASEQMSQTLWDEAFQNVVVDHKPNWMKQNFGKASVNTDEQFVIVDAKGKAIFASEFDGAPPPDKVAALLTAAAAPMQQARALYRATRAADNGFSERLPGAMTDGVYVNDTIRVGGRPALITISPFTPDDENVDTPEEATLLLGVRFMSDALLARLSKLANVEGVKLADDANVEAGTVPTHAITDSSGNKLVHVTWSASQPGTAILHAALPAIGASVVLVTLLTLIAALTVRRLTRRLANSEQAALYASRHDAATGLVNRGWFMTVFQHMLAPGGSAGGAYAALLIDCDYFKSINDTLGHAAGDAVLAAVSRRLKSLGDRIAVAARLGGDEFALISTRLGTDCDAAALVESVEAALMKPVEFETHAIPVSVSIGAVVFESATQHTIDHLLAKADLALYRAKRDGRGCSRLYDPAIDDSTLLLVPQQARAPANDPGTRAA